MGHDTETFACGHEAAGGNLMPDGRGGHRCRECHRARCRESWHRHRVDRRPPREDFELHEEEMQRSSNRLLQAMYRAHPYVFDAAERSGRQAVRP